MLEYEDVVLVVDKVELENMVEGRGVEWAMLAEDRLRMELIAMFQRR
jgi:hypothetical protein